MKLRKIILMAIDPHVFFFFFSKKYSYRTLYCTYVSLTPVHVEGNRRAFLHVDYFKPLLTNYTGQECMKTKHNN